MNRNRKWFLSPWILVCLLAFVHFSCVSDGLHAAKSTENESGWQGEVDQLNEKIALLRRWQEGYRMTAEQAQFKADRLQFEQENLIDAKRLWKVAENANQKAQDLQMIIEKLEDQRNTILRKHDQPIPKDERMK